ncbi:hypothetical protein MMC06_005665 [Schaereria dolodes]|nr:hypothetical protein [Schaereria dolodes]
MDDKDVSNYSSSSHRLPTVSASQALHDLDSPRYRTISTGLTPLDAALRGQHIASTSPWTGNGGLSRGQVTEIYGPPGVGKTSLALQACAGALNAGEAVVWIGKENCTVHYTISFSGCNLIAGLTDTSHQLVRSRFLEIVLNFRVPESHYLPSSPPIARPLPDLLDNFHHFTTPTLPHLLALLAQPSSSFPPDRTGLIVVDSISAILTTAFPKAAERYDNNNGLAKKNDSLQWASSRRWSVMGDIISRLGKLSAVQSLAICLIAQTTSRIRYETGAVLHPAISGKFWDDGIANRIVLFRDWPLSVGDETRHGELGGRFAGVVKAGGTTYNGIGRHGLQEVTASTALKQQAIPPVVLAAPLKRKREEIADSQSENGSVDSDEEFGWADDGLLGAEGLVEELTDEMTPRVHGI